MPDVEVAGSALTREASRILGKIGITATGGILVDFVRVNVIG
jgi:hypothetical protein